MTVTTTRMLKIQSFQLPLWESHWDEVHLASSLAYLEQPLYGLGLHGYVGSVLQNGW